MTGGSMVTPLSPLNRYRDDMTTDASTNVLKKEHVHCWHGQGHPDQSDPSCCLCDGSGCPRARGESAREHFERTHHTVEHVIDSPGWRCTRCPARAAGWNLRRFQ